MSCHQSLERFLGRQIKVLNHAFGRRIREESSARGLDELTIMHGRILGYLKYNQDRDVFQKDIEEAFNITRSSVTAWSSSWSKRATSAGRAWRETPA